MKEHNWLPYKDALKMVLKDAKRFNIDSEKKWHYQYIANGEKPFNIPSHPQIIYKNNGWVSWAQWLGTNNIRGSNRKYDINDDFFKKWSHNMAYILGFWFADGNIRKRNDKFKRGGNFSISQQTPDAYILKNILKSMSSNYPIFSPSTRKNASMFEISSNEIYNDIIELGGTQRKSLTAMFPNVPTKFLPDFIRGVFDGDGSISVLSKNHSASCYISGGSERFLQDLNKHLFDIWGICGRLIYSKTCFRLYFKINAIIKLSQIMYGTRQTGMLRLERKYNKFQDLIKYRENHIFYSKKNTINKPNNKEKICHKE